MGSARELRHLLTASASGSVSSGSGFDASETAIHRPRFNVRNLQPVMTATWAPNPELLRLRNGSKTALETAVTSEFMLTCRLPGLLEPRT